MFSRAFHLFLLSSLITVSTAQSKALEELKISVKDLLSEQGSLVFLQAEHVSSHFKDGTPNYFEILSYGGKGRLSNMSCLAEYTTAYLKDLRLVPNDVDEQPGTVVKWKELPQYHYEALSDNRYEEYFVIRTTQENGLAQLSCSVSYHDSQRRATIEEFYEGTGGRLTFGQ
jgi:hypothetical protein